VYRGPTIRTFASCGKCIRPAPRDAVRCSPSIPPPVRTRLLHRARPARGSQRHSGYVFGTNRHSPAVECPRCRAFTRRSAAYVSRPVWLESLTPEALCLAFERNQRRPSATPTYPSRREVRRIFNLQSRSAERSQDGLSRRPHFQMDRFSATADVSRKCPGTLEMETDHSLSHFQSQDVAIFDTSPSKIEPSLSSFLCWTSIVSDCSYNLISRDQTFPEITRLDTHLSQLNDPLLPLPTFILGGNSRRFIARISLDRMRKCHV
jgi:hypothetical protein